jgi:quercetin dioxygenase-like cupin family protein
MKSSSKAEAEVLRWDEASDGVLSESAMRKKFESLGYSSSRWTYEPGTYFSPHTHGVDKIDGVLAGRFKITIFGEAVILGPGDAVRVPRGAEHSAEVIGDEAVVSLDAVLESSSRAQR